MKNIIVITGGGSGIGLGTARILGQDNKVLITGRTEEKLKLAVEDLRKDGAEADYAVLDVIDKDDVEALAEKLFKEYNIKSVVHCAGMGGTVSPRDIFTINAMGTIIVNEAFSPYMKEGGVIVNIASIGGYSVPPEMQLDKIYPKALDARDEFTSSFYKMFDEMELQPAKDIAYFSSKQFSHWWARKMAHEYGKKGIRIVSVSPGVIDTPMVDAEEGDTYTNLAAATALGRKAQPEEVGRLIRFLISDDASYLTGSDIIYDGGALAAIEHGLFAPPQA